MRLPINYESATQADMIAHFIIYNTCDWFMISIDIFIFHGYSLGSKREVCNKSKPSLAANDLTLLQESREKRK